MTHRVPSQGKSETGESAQGEPGAPAGAGASQTRSTGAGASRGSRRKSRGESGTALAHETNRQLRSLQEFS
jgi:hypothetical protein